MKANALLALRKQADALYTDAVRSTDDRDPIDGAPLRRVERVLAQERRTIARIDVTRGIATRGRERPWRVGVRIEDNGNEDVRGCRRATAAAYRALRDAGLHSDRISVIDARASVACRPWGRPARGTGRKLDDWEKRHNERTGQPSIVSASIELEADAESAVEIALRAITQSLMNDGYRVEVTREENVIALPAKAGAVEKKKHSRAKSQGDVKDAKRAVRGMTKRNAHWETLPPDTPHPSPKSAVPCKLKHVGASVPGRGGGRVTACATPSKKRPREGQYWIGEFSSGHPMRRTVVSRRLRNAEAHAGFDRFAAPEAAAMAKREKWHVPSPIGTEFPHRRGTSPCDAEHPLWAEWQDAYEAASERAAIANEEGDDEAFQRAVLAEMRKHPHFEKWEGTERACIEAIDRRRRAAAPKAAMSAARERALERIAFVNAGGDTSSSEWTDRLASAGGRKRRLRYHRAG
ncbi:MAG: hypothetical protein U0269_30745 [Polyangiales bacterium]